MQRALTPTAHRRALISALSAAHRRMPHITLRATLMLLHCPFTGADEMVRRLGYSRNGVSVIAGYLERAGLMKRTRISDGRAFRGGIHTTYDLTQEGAALFLPDSPSSEHP